MKSTNILESYKLSDKYTVYRTKYSGEYTKGNFLNRVTETEALFAGKTFDNHNSLQTYLECDEFHSVDRYALNCLREITSQKIERHFRSSWLYVQVPEFKLEWMHTHDWLESSNRIKLKTNWTYVYYIQIPTNLKEDQGDLVFKTEDKNLHKITPKENEIIFFPGDIPHMPIPTIGSDINRIVYTSNINYDFNYFRETNKRVHFYNHTKSQNEL